jgi:two-component system, LuxR family, sensor kinase FixL
MTKLKQPRGDPKSVTQDTASDSALFGVLLDLASDGIIIFDEKGLIKVFSATCVEFFGRRKDEVVGKNMRVLFRNFQNERDDPWKTGRSREVLCKHRDRSTFPMCLSVGEGIFRNQKIFVGILHNLADHKLDDTVREREARLNSILDTVPDATIITNEDGTIESFSRAASILFGHEPDGVIGKSVTMLMASPFREEHDGALGHSTGGYKRIVGRSRIIVGLRLDGSTFPMEFTVGEISGGAQRHFTGFMRDITQRRGTEKRLEELLSELLHVSRLSAMGQMTAAIAHEVNQPLAAIIQYVAAAKRTLDTVKLTPTALKRARSMIDKAAKQVLRAGAIIKNLRDFVEKREGVRKPEALKNVIAEALALAFVGAAGENVKVKLHLDVTLGLVAVDKIQIQQVLLNLIRNSVEAMRSTDKRDLLLATGAGEPGFANVTVQDSGPGLPQDVVRRLFQPFVTTKETGMGIGLTICQSIVEAHGGRIWLVRSTHEGTSFCFSLPFAPQLASAA